MRPQSPMILLAFDLGHGVARIYHGGGERMVAAYVPGELNGGQLGFEIDVDRLYAVNARQGLGYVRLTMATRMSAFDQSIP